MTICLYYQYSGFKNFKGYYEQIVSTKDFPNKLSISRFTELKEQVIVRMKLFMESKLKNSTRVSITDSTVLKSCHIRRVSSNKTLPISNKSKTNIGWFL